MRLILLLLIAVVLLPGQVGAGASRVAQGAQQVRELVPGVSIERELRGSEVHAYRITLASGQYVHVVVQEQINQVMLTVLEPDGKEVLGANTSWAIDYISVIAEIPGTYLLQVRPRQKESGRARYLLRMEERRLATPRDRIRVAAQRAFVEGLEMLKQWDPNLPAAADADQQVVRKFETALSLLQPTGDQRLLAETLSDIAGTLGHFQKFQQAVEYWEQSLRLWQMIGDRQKEDSVFVELSSIYMIWGEYEKALEYASRGLALPEARHYPEALNVLAGIYASLGNYQRALEYYGRALALDRKLGLAGRWGEAARLHNIGRVYRWLGDYQRALEAASQSLVISRALGVRRLEVAALSSIAIEHQFLGELEKALVYYNQALPLLRTEGFTFAEAETLRNMGSLYLSLSKPHEALDHYAQALTLCRKLDYRAGEAATLSAIGGVYLTEGEHEKAFEHYRQAVERSRTIGLPAEEAASRSGIAHVERERGHLSEARTQIEAALGIVGSLRTSVVSPELRAAYQASVQVYFEFYIDLLMRLHERESSQAHDAQALEASERARARGLLDLLAEARIDVTQGVASELKQREKATHASISRIQSQLIQAHSTATPDKPRIAQLEDDLKKVESEREHLEIEIRQKHPHYAELQYPQPLGVKAIQALLDDQTALLEYALGKDRSFLFIMSREGLHSVRLPPAEKINRLVHDLRAVLGRSGERRSRYRDWSTYVGTARRLYQMLIAPAADVLAKKQNLVIVPDGVLYYLPFESLLSDAAKTSGRADYRALPYLLKQWTVSYAPSASVLASLGQRHPKTDAQPVAKTLIAFADPVYEISQTTDPRPKTQNLNTKSKGQRTTNNEPRTNAVKETLRSLFEKSGRWELPPLEYSNREVTAIAKLHRQEDVAVYRGADATEEKVKTNEHLGSARRIHFATHGIMSERQPQYSGLILSLPPPTTNPKSAIRNPQSVEDGLLQVYEIFNLKLNAELVVLSACETGLGKEVKGEGLIGLTRAFMYAGTPSVVVSLWQVADRSTADLMVMFYEQLNQGRDKAEALRRAKLAMIERGGVSAQPFSWAPFILVGESK
jgi:CHAT domain-containing protein